MSPEDASSKIGGKPNRVDNGKMDCLNQSPEKNPPRDRQRDEYHSLCHPLLEWPVAIRGMNIGCRKNRNRLFRHLQLRVMKIAYLAVIEHSINCCRYARMLPPQTLILDPIAAEILCPFRKAGARTLAGPDTGGFSLDMN